MTQKAGSGLSYSDFREGLSSTTPRPVFKSHLLPHFDACDLGNWFPSLIVPVSSVGINANTFPMEQVLLF